MPVLKGVTDGEDGTLNMLLKLLGKEGKEESGGELQPSNKTVILQSKKKGQGD